MSRSSLFEFLPDLSGDAPPRRRARGEGFEPLVAEASGRPEFSAIDVNACFTEPEPLPPEEPGGVILDTEDLLAELGELGELGDLDGHSDEHDDHSGLSSVDQGLHHHLHHAPADEEPPAAPFFNEDGDPGGAALASPSDTNAPLADAAAVAPDALAVSHSAELEEQERSHNSTVNKLVSSSIPKLREEIIQSISEELAALVSGHIRVAIAERMLAAITDEIRRLLSDGDAVSFELRGPEALIATFREQWSEDDVEIRTVLAESVDLVARVDQAVVATRLSEVDRLLQECAA